MTLVPRMVGPCRSPFPSNVTHQNQPTRYPHTTTTIIIDLKKESSPIIDQSHFAPMIIILSSFGSLTNVPSPDPGCLVPVNLLEIGHSSATSDKLLGIH